MSTVHVQTRMSCPHCHQELDGTVEEYAIPDEVGEASAHVSLCWHCYRFFMVANAGNGEYVIDAEVDVAEG